MDTQYEWEGDDDMASAYDPLEENDFNFDFDQQAQMGLGTDEDEIFIDGLMGGGVGPWKVSLSAQAMKDLQESRSEGNHRHILAKLRSLASGDWVRRSVARPYPLGGRHFRVRLFQALYGGNGRILWQVDVGYDDKCRSESQIVRVWRIGDVKEIHASLDAVERSQNTFSTIRVERCKQHNIDRGARLKLPVVFESYSGEENRGNDGPETGTDSKDPPGQERVAQDILISGRFHTLTVNVFTSILHGQVQLDFPFDVTGTEATIIKHKNATFILGRSGTGKTSCLLYKLMCRYLARNIAMPDEPIRQLLLTRSGPLAQKLQSEVKLLLDTQLSRVADYLQADGDIILYEDGNDISVQIENMDNVDADTTEDFQSFGTANFPFVCTFDHFLRRLENTIMANDQTSISTRHLIDYTDFRVAYWPRFPPRSKGHLQSDMVFTEIMGVLKGGGAPLSRQEYIDTSARIAPTFTTEADRQAVYTLFELYEKRKRERGEHDGIDRVRCVMRVLEDDPVLENKIKTKEILMGMFEEVYVDEVQDQRPLEISLLLKLVQDPRGIHFAGDSAQCISQDSTFRFANLKALFFNHFSGHRLTATDPSAAKATRFTLSHNFRSHQGILRLASWVMDKLWRGYPDCVDKLPPEIGTHMGPKPVIIVGPSLVKFLRGAAGGTTGDQINTQQIIIVRDRGVQTELESDPQLPGGSIVFTVLQSKGMEYDDVFLYEFFSRSPCLGGFRNMMEDGCWERYAAEHASMCNELKNLYVAITRPRSRLFILESDPGCIPTLLTEHAKVPLVVVKRFNNEDLESLSQEVHQSSTPGPTTSSSQPTPAQTGTPAHIGAPAQTGTVAQTSAAPQAAAGATARSGIFDTVRPTSTTTAEQWIETGNQCMERGIFDQALRCFRNARDPDKVKLASASLSEQRGRECSARRDSMGVRAHFKEASDGFRELGMNERAAACLEARGDLVNAAELYREARRYEKAARLFKRTGHYDRAADNYLKCGKSSLGLLTLYEGKLYDRLITDFHYHRDKIQEIDRLTYARECNIAIRKKGKRRADLQSKALAMFTSDKEKETFLKEFKYSKELVEFYVCRGRIKEALLHAITSDDFDDALEGMIERGWDSSEVVVAVEGVEKEEMRLEDVFNYAQTKRMLASMSGESKSLSLDYNGRHAGIEWGRKWEGFVAVAGEYITSGVELERGCIKEEWIREYLDIIVSINIKYFLGVTKDLAAIPHAYLYGLAQRISKISKSMKEDEASTSTEDHGIPQAVLLALGVLHIPGEAKPYKVLGWSCLNSSKVDSRTDLDREVMVKKIVDYLTKRLLDASPLVEERAEALWEGFPGTETKCAACMTRVAWGGPQVGGLSTKCSHNPITKAQFGKSIEVLIGIHSSFVTMGEEYKLLEGVRTPEYLAHLNEYWLNALLNKLTYRSACFESAECIASLRNRLRTPEASTLVNALQRRFREQWAFWRSLKCQEDFAQLLEDYQLGVNVGLGRNELDDLINGRRTVIEEYHAKRQGAGGRHPRRNKKREEKPSEETIIFEVLRQYRALHEWKEPSHCSMAIVLNWIDGLLQTLHGMLQSTKYLSLCHASVISVFESILTLLLFASHRTDIVVPASWTHLHLPLWAPTLRNSTDNEMECYRRALVRVMGLFYRWVIDGHGSAPQDGSLQRRCLDVCFVALVNVGTVAGCQGLWAKAQEVLTNKTFDSEQALRTQPHQLIEQLSEAFELYNGTDTLTLHVREGILDRRALYLSRFVTPQLLPPRPQHPPARGTLYSIYLIASWCRRRHGIRSDYKRYRGSATWQAVDRLHALCKNRPPLAVAVMTDGLELYLLLQDLKQRIGAVHEKDRQRVEKEASVRNASHKNNVDVVVSGKPEQKSAVGSMAASDQTTEMVKTESEILHSQLQERAPGKPEQKGAEESMAASDQTSETVKTESEILHAQLQERVSGKPEQKGAESMAATDQTTETVKTESEILHAQLQERVSGKPEQKGAEESMAASDQTSETVKTESEILHAQLQERVSGKPEQKGAEESMAASDQTSETVKTESEILHAQLQERDAFFDVGTTVDMDAERWRERCREEMTAIQEMEKTLKDWLDKLDGKVKPVVVKEAAKDPKTTSKKAKSTRKGKGAAVGQSAPPELPQDQAAQGDTPGDKNGEVAAPSNPLSRRAKRNAAKREEREKKQAMKGAEEERTE